MDIKKILDKSWQDILESEFDKEYFKELNKFIEKEYLMNPEGIFPSKENVFRAFSECKFEDVKLVIIGQDPYPTKGHAHGLCFSVAQNVRPFPKSLNNIFKEIQADLGTEFPQNGNLERWVNQGVLLLNSVLTVKEGEAGSHSNIGWEKFTDKIIACLNEYKTGVVYLLWGAKAIEKAKNVNAQKNLILSSVHPSPLSAYRGFFGSKHFSQANNYLIMKKKTPIKW
ncbi:MAG: uracil-DNA glycosylase [Flavobacteriia bacterium]|nr:uracil-DNA glycosylase [Flavobacteriia bacterium]